MFIALLAGALAIGVAAAIAFWPQIVNWAQESLFPFIRKNFPELSDLFTKAFTIIDKGFSAIRRKIKQAWQKFRAWLLKQAITFSRQTNNIWVKTITSWLIKTLDSPTPKVTKVETEEDVDWAELPDEIRESYLRQNIRQSSINFTEIRDKEIAEMEMAG